MNQRWIFPSPSPAVQYRLIDYDEGKWNWEQAKTFLDAGEHDAARLSPGRKTRTLTLSDIAPGESGYLMLQIFALSGEEVILCSERLIALQPTESDAQLSLLAPDAFTPDEGELSIGVLLDVPAEITVSIYDADGALVRRLCQSQLTRPTPQNLTRLYWDGRDASGLPLPPGVYTVRADAYIGGMRHRVTQDVTLAAPYTR